MLQSCTSASYQVYKFDPVDPCGVCAVDGIVKHDRQGVAAICHVLFLLGFYGFGDKLLATIYCAVVVHYNAGAGVVLVHRIGKFGMKLLRCRRLCVIAEYSLCVGKNDCEVHFISFLPVGNLGQPPNGTPVGGRWSVSYRSAENISFAPDPIARATIEPAVNPEVVNATCMLLVNSPFAATAVTGEFPPA